jgi:hypothetical protein
MAAPQTKARQLLKIYFVELRANARLPNSMARMPTKLPSMIPVTGTVVCGLAVTPRLDIQ